MPEVGRFARVGTDFLHVFETFLDVFDNFAAHVVRIDKPAVLNFLGKSDQKRCGGYDPEKRDGHFPVVAEEHDADNGDASDGGEKFRHRMRENHFERIAVVHDGRRQIRKVLFAKEGKR